MRDRSSQLAEALAEALTSFRLEPGETLGTALDRIDQRFQGSGKGT